VIVLCAAVAAGLWFWRVRARETPADMVAFLPASDSLVLYIDMRAVRRSGILDSIAGSKSAEEPEYRRFIEQTGFDYRENLDALAIAIRDNPISHERDLYTVVSGDFDWDRIPAYVTSQGGVCSAGFCRIPASQPHRFVSFYKLRRHLLALATSTDQWGALQVTRRPGVSPPSDLPTEPVWMLVPSAVLQSSADLFPEGTLAYASALRGAQRVVLSLGPQGDHLAVSLEASCRNADDAAALVAQLQKLTDTLRTWIVREHAQANPADLSGVLTAGTFHRDDRRVYGIWPIQREFIQALSK
jgi:hypothetical protein